MVLFSSCKQKNVQNSGGIIMDLEIGDSLTSKADISQTAEIIKKRVEMICLENPIVNINGNIIHIEMPIIFDTILCKTLLIQKGEFEIIESYEAKDVLVYLSDINKKLVENKNFNFTFPIDSTLLPDNPLFNLISIESDQGISNGPGCGYVMPKDTALIDSIFSNPNLSILLPRDLSFKWAKEKSTENQEFFILIAGKIRLREKLITSEMIQNAKMNDNDGFVEIDLELKQEYHNRWKRITRENIGRSLIMILDGIVVSYPIVQDEIPEGKSSISGNYTNEEAKAIAAILKYGVLSSPVKIKQITLHIPN